MVYKLLPRYLRQGEQEVLACFGQSSKTTMQGLDRELMMRSEIGIRRLQH
jgi:hypothetical protein